MHSLVVRVAIILIVLATLAITSAQIGTADHESLSTMTFAPSSEGESSTATGEGTIEYNGGTEPDSRWTVTFQFTGLRPESRYVVVIEGRDGVDGSPRAAAFSPLCSFTTDRAGDGVCWNYLLGMRRVKHLQLRAEGEDGEPVLTATSREGGPGMIRHAPNRFSPSAIATPAASPGAGFDATPTNNERT